MQTAQELKNSTLAKGQQMAEKATATVAQRSGDVIEGFKSQVGNRFEQMEDQARELADSSARILKNNPWYALAGAGVIGLAAGLFFGRRR